MRSRLKRGGGKEGQRKGHKEGEEGTAGDGGEAVTPRQRRREKQVANLRGKNLRAKKGQITVMARGALQPRGAIHKPKQASDSPTILSVSTDPNWARWRKMETSL